MTTTDRVHDQGFCYDGDVPPSIPPGKPLRQRGTPEERRSTQSALRRSASKLASLRGRIGL